MIKKQAKVALGLVLALGLTAVSCDNKGEQILRLQEQNDSLTQVSTQQQDVIDGLASTMEEITQSLDTIAKQEQIVLSGLDERGVPLTKRNMRAKLEALSNLIKEQHSKLDSLGKALDSSNSTLAKLRGVITLLNKSLEERTHELDSLKTEITYKDINILNLGTKVANLTDTVKNVRSENASQKQTIASQKQNIGQQDAALHEVYYAIGTKDELLSTGVVVKEGGLFKKKKVNFAGLNKSALKKADIRTLKHLDIPCKNPKILGEVPETSYRLTKGESTSSIDILDADKFWSSNNRVLVIQVK